MKEKKEDANGLCSRRSLLAGSAALLTGGLVSGIQNIYAGPAPKATAPPLPWKWVKLDPLEAGRRAYRNYLKNKG